MDRSDILLLGSRPARLLGVLAIACLAAGCGDDSKPGEPMVPARDYVLKKFSRGTTGMVRNNAGAGIDVSPGTVPTTSQGQPGELVFSVEPAEVQATPPAGLSTAGQPWQFGPEGITFAQRARISLPVPDTTKTYALGRLDASTTVWELVPSLVVPGLEELVFADVIHLSAWTLLEVNPTDPKAPGKVRFTNVDGTRWVALCVRAFNPTFPEQDAGFSSESVGILLSEAGHTSGVIDRIDAILPQGSWVFEATRTVPIGANFTAEPDGWVVLDPIDVGPPGGSVQSIDLDPSTFTDVQDGRSPCEGVPDFVFGTGAVQITLTWDDAVDLDLRVFDPANEEIYYGHTMSASGGMLDRDRVCADASSGRPENVFWSSTAPRGNYTVKVNLYSICSTTLATVPFRVRTVVDGNVRTFPASVGQGETKTVTTFTR